MKVFFDTNVLMDVLAKRAPFYQDSAAIWTLAECGKIAGLASAVSFTNIYYVVRKLSNPRNAHRALALLRDVFTPLACDARVLYQAMDARFCDFEDAIQFISALHAEADCLVSRNPDHFPSVQDCPVLTPAEFHAADSFD
jgi:predicted nucleic acid-binding protein